jgi:hypothetical protein
MEEKCASTDVLSFGVVICCSIVFFDLVLYGWAVLPFAYLLSFLFNVASTAYTWILVINLFTGKFFTFPPQRGVKCRSKISIVTASDDFKTDRFSKQVSIFMQCINL